MQNVFRIEGTQKNLINLAMYIAIFFVAWSLYVFFVQKHFSHYYLFLKMGLVKIMIWTIPVLLYLKYYDKVDPLTYLKLKGNIKKGLIYVIIVSSFYFFVSLVQQYIILKYIKFHAISNIGIWVNGIILAGFTEEILFRGYILQKLDVVFSFWSANCIAAFLFLLIHFPGWSYHGSLSLMNIDILAIFIFGLISGYVLKKSHSLWACILIHAVNNFIFLSQR